MLDNADKLQDSNGNLLTKVSSTEEYYIIDGSDYVVRVDKEKGLIEAFGIVNNGFINQELTEKDKLVLSDHYKITTFP